MKAIWTLVNLDRQWVKKRQLWELRSVQGRPDAREGATLADTVRPFKCLQILKTKIPTLNLQQSLARLPTPEVMTAPTTSPWVGNASVGTSSSTPDSTSNSEKNEHHPLIRIQAVDIWMILPSLIHVSTLFWAFFSNGVSHFVGVSLFLFSSLPIFFASLIL